MSSEVADTTPTPHVEATKKLSTTHKFRDPKDLLLAVSAVVKNRTGSVLGRQMILKSDHFETAVNLDIDIHLQGATNFRMADLNIFGCAQPTVPGVITILTLLRCGYTTLHASPSAIFDDKLHHDTSATTFDDKNHCVTPTGKGSSYDRSIPAKSVLDVLSSTPDRPKKLKVNDGPFATWISTREEPMIYINRKPFVIRDSKKPFENINTYQGNTFTFDE